MNLWRLMHLSPIYKTELPTKDALFLLYEELGWNDFLALSAEQLLLAMRHSFFAVYAYDGDKLIGTGRVVSDGVINAYICGLGVLPEYRNRGVGSEIMNRLKT